MIVQFVNQYTVCDVENRCVTRLIARSDSLRNTEVEIELLSLSAWIRQNMKCHFVVRSE